MNPPVTRRGALRSAATAALGLAAGVAPAAASAAPEPIVAMLRRATALRAEVNDRDKPDGTGEALYDEMMDAIGQAAEMPISTPATALAALAWARDEFAEAHVRAVQPDHLDLVTLRFLDCALDVLRGALGEGAA